MLNLNPRYNLFRFMIPKDIIPTEIEEKWTNILNDNVKRSIRMPIDIINQSIVSVSIPGIQDSAMIQNQTGKNDMTGMTEGLSEVAYRNTQSAFDSVKPSIEVTFKHIQGFYNYLLLYETWFYHAMKRNDEIMPDLYLEFLNETGEIVMFMTLYDPVFVGLDGLQLSYNRVERGTDEFTVTFTGRAIDFDFGKRPLAG